MNLKPNLIIGVLALQGAFAKHCQMLEKLSVDYIEVRTISELEKCDGLIIPGGESTTILSLLEKNGLKHSLLKYQKPIYGTCAGLIILAKEIENSCLSPLGLLNIKVRRNGYGRQLHSFSTTLHCQTENTPFTFEAFFIRAPQITQLFSKDIKILSTYDYQPVFIKQKNIFASTFHPELTDETKIHRLFLTSVQLYR